MKIVLAKTAGFCMGVRRAVETALGALNRLTPPIYTFGPLIHNPQVLNLLKERGITVLNDIPENASGTVIIRAHGIPPSTKDKLKKAGFTIIDATCPRVIKVQTIVSNHAEQGYNSIIIGDKEHPEVIGLLGFAGGKGFVAGSIKDLENLPPFDKAIIVAQTTQNTLLFEEVKKWAQFNFPHYKVFDTICDSTENHQEEIRKLAKTVDAIVVVGGRNSGNTKRLTDIAKKTGKPAFHIESESELNIPDLSRAKTIALSAGASTPNWIIKRVYRSLEMLSVSKTMSLKAMWFNIQRFLLLTNIAVALGAGCLCYASSKIQGIGTFSESMLIAIIYILTMHIINNLTGSKTDQYNDPDRAAFYKTHKAFVSILAAVSGIIGIANAYIMGKAPFIIIIVMSLLGLSYNFRLAPKSFSLGSYKGMRDIPGSKTILIATAWGIVTSVFPAIATSAGISFKTILAFLWTTSLVFSRTAFLDILDMQGDMIVGKETIPILIGEAKTLKILKYTLACIILLFIFSGILNWISTLGFFLIICPLLMFLFILFHEKGYIYPATRLEILIELNLILAGVITLIWSAAIA